jgi:hypothetical protein
MVTEEEKQPLQPGGAIDAERRGGNSIKRTRFCLESIPQKLF